MLYLCPHTIFKGNLLVEKVKLYCLPLAFNLSTQIKSWLRSVLHSFLWKKQEEKVLCEKLSSLSENVRLGVCVTNINIIHYWFTWYKRIKILPWMRMYVLWTQLLVGQQFLRNLQWEKRTSQHFLNTSLECIVWNRFVCEKKGGTKEIEC